MTDHETKLLTLVAAAIASGDNHLDAISKATAALKAMDELSATINSSQVDRSSADHVMLARIVELKNEFAAYRESKDAEIAKLTAANENLAKMWQNEIKQFRAYREERDAEIARLERLADDRLSLWKTCTNELASVYGNFSAYRERMESPLTEEECVELGPYSTVMAWDRSIRKVREGGKP